MPRGKKKSTDYSLQTTAKKTKTVDRSPLASSSIPEQIRNFRPSRNQLITVAILALAGLLYLNKSWIVAATVNGQPISSLEVNRRLNSAYRETILAEIINETIVEQEAAKKGVMVSRAEVNNRLAEEEKAYGGHETFEAILAQQGIGYADYQRRTQLILTMERLYQKEVEPTEEELKNFMTENANLPEATDEAKFQALAETSVKQQKFTSIISEKFPELKKSADIKIF